MKKLLLALAIFQLSTFNFQLVHAQTWPEDPVIMEVAGQKIRQSEFMKEFMTSVGDKLAKNPQTPLAEKRQALREYVDLFANFRAKVADAEALGFDTVTSLREELAKYRGELAAPYLIDSAVLEGLLREAYARNAWSLHCAHILVHVAPDASPADTLAALQRITELRNRIMAGEDFYAVASETVKDNGRPERKRPDEGNLGYFTAFDMVYPFENAAYALNIGEVSQPVRTRYGYHIIKLFDKVHMQGKVDMAHIWIGRRDSVAGRKAAYEQYERLNRGVSFDEVALQSDDHTTYANGGRMMNAGLNQLPPEYIHAIENMQPGEYSEPFHTQYGWHIVKLIRRDTLPPYEAMVPYYKQKMTRDQRGDASRKVFADKCREKYNVIDLTKTPVPQPAKKKGKKNEPVKMQASLDSLYTIVPKNIVMGKWDYDDSLVKDIQTLVRVGDREYNTLDLARYINTHRNADREMKIPYYVNMRYEEFIDSVAVLYANSQLENENPEFAAIVDEYRRGLMIFNYNDKMIWSKAIYDTVGFTEFYDRQSKTKRMTNPADSVYFWKTRARVTVLTVRDSSLLAPAKAVKLLTKAQKKSKGSAEMRDILLKAIGKKANGSDAVRSEIDLVEQGRTPLLAADQWSNGVYVSPFKKGYRAVVVEEVLPPCLKTRLEARGYYLNEYQNELERNLNRSLREKYNVKINYDIVDSIVY